MKKHCSRILAALALTLALMSPAVAADGIMWSEIATPPPPGTAGIMHTDEAADGIIWTGLAQPMAQLGLSLLAGLR